VKLQTLSFSNLIIHRIPKKPERTQPDSGPVFSDAADPQSAEVRVYFQRRLRGVMAERGLEIENDPALDARAIDAIAAVLADTKKLVPSSQSLAQLLYDAQDRRNPEGILVIALGELEGLPALGILKLEHERGITAEEETTADGRVFKIVLHEDLMLTERTVVFKGAIFRRRSAKSDALVALASDMQVERNLASFFLEKFLGCRLVTNPAKATEDYFDAAESFIATVDDPEKRARYEMALLTQMHSAATTTVDPVKFARDTLTVNENQPFLDRLKDRGVSDRSFPKDTSAIEGRIKRLAYNFESGIKLIGKPEAMKQHVSVDKPQDGRSRVTIDDQIATVRARG
jgi:hypothetical protein